MRLHRLVLTNYRGITHRDIEFPEHGVTVVCGPNEVGKSSMIEALDLLLESKDRSTKRDVKQVKPTHADVGSEVMAEISTGPYRFVYRKRFHKKCETQLTVLAPRREQLTGDEAHDRVRTMLDATVDTGLWQAQRVLQSDSTSAVDLSGCDALSRALDLAAGDSAALSGNEPLLIEKIDAEYAKYFTATGRPTGDWAAAAAALKAAEEDVARCAAAVAEVDDDVRRHASLSAELTELDSRTGDIVTRHTAARAAADAVAALTEQVRTAQLMAGAALATSAAAASAHTERLRLRKEMDTRAATVAELEITAAAAIDAEATGREVVTAADMAAEQAAHELRAAQDRFESARATVARLSDRDEADRLVARLERIEATQRDSEQAVRALSAIVLTDTMMRRIETASAAIDVVRGQLDLAATTVEFSAHTDIELALDGEPMTLGPGQEWTLTAAEPAQVVLPGVLTVRVTPGATALDVQAKLAAVQQNLTELLAAAGVVDIEQARAVDERRRELITARDRLAATLGAHCGDENPEQLQARLATLRAREPHESGPFDLATDAEGARAELEVAEVALAKARVHNETQRKVAAAAVVQLTERATLATVSREKLGAQRAELAIASARLTAQRGEAADDDLAVRAQTHADQACAANDRAAAFAAQLAGAEPDAVAAELAAAKAAADALDASRTRAAQALNDVSVELAVFKTEGRTGQLDAAQIKREHAAAAYSRIRARARAVDLLRSVMVRHRDNTRLRYVEPFRAEVERLGRTVFGPTFEVEVDSALRIVNRTLGGRTVPYESLSGGAKEQLGIVARLAVAALVAKEDTVPVMIDDALGFTDPDRLAKMGAVFDVVGAQGQVIVLTCMPERYRGVGGAHHIELTA